METQFLSGDPAENRLDRYTSTVANSRLSGKTFLQSMSVFQRTAPGRHTAPLPTTLFGLAKATDPSAGNSPQPPLRAYQPHWSPDGSRIAFMGQAPNQPSRIFIVSASGGQPQAVEPGDSMDQGVPSWSGDGRYLVFGELLDRHADDEMLIRLLDLKTRKETILPGSKAKWTPRWSPDGRYILAVATKSGSLALFDCAASRWIPLVAADSIDDPVWSLDSRFVHFSALRSGDGGRALFRVSIADARVEQLAPYPPSPVRWSGVTPDGSPLVLSSTRIEDIFAITFK